MDHFLGGIPFALLIEGYEIGVDVFLARVQPGFAATADHIEAASETNPAWSMPEGHLFWDVGLMFAGQSLSNADV
ncbi:MAG TPA: hypothetical protein VMG10_21580 [Gemmataceae bacterium]|nr:hypothetical protein [Gemmataceae bacterium]